MVGGSSSSCRARSLRGWVGLPSISEQAPSCIPALGRKTTPVPRCRCSPGTCKRSRSTRTPAGERWAASGSTCTPAEPSVRLVRSEAYGQSSRERWGNACYPTRPKERSWFKLSELVLVSWR